MEWNEMKWKLHIHTSVLTSLGFYWGADKALVTVAKQVEPEGKQSTAMLDTMWAGTCGWLNVNADDANWNTSSTTVLTCWFLTGIMFTTFTLYVQDDVDESKPNTKKSFFYMAADPVLHIRMHL